MLVYYFKQQNNNGYSINKAMHCLAAGPAYIGTESHSRTRTNSKSHAAE